MSKLKYCTLAKIHQVIRDTSNINEAAAVLKVDYTTLGRLLTKASLPYKYLKDATVEALQELYADKYEKPLTSKKVDLRDYTLAQIQSTIQENRSIAAAGNALGVCYRSIEYNLGKILLKGEPLSYTRLQRLSTDTVFAVFGDKYFLSKLGDLQFESYIASKCKTETEPMGFFGKRPILEQKATDYQSEPRP